MVADYEAAWVELGGLIASREGWGSRALASEMARVLARHRLTEPQIERVLRLYGGRVAVVMQTPEAPANGHGGTPTAPAPVPGQTKDQEVRDGEQHRREEGRVG